jgi:hypothetical protein
VFSGKVTKLFHILSLSFEVKEVHLTLFCETNAACAVPDTVCGSVTSFFKMRAIRSVDVVAER